MVVVVIIVAMMMRKEAEGQDFEESSEDPVL